MIEKNNAIKYLDARDPIDFEKSVDVLNSVLGVKYLGKIFKGWQRGAFTFQENETKYIVWFPKLAVNGKAASSFGWINELKDNGNTITEIASESTPEIGYNLDDSIRLVFAKEANAPYRFRGVFAQDKEKCTFRYHVFHKVADIADFREEDIKIYYNRSEDSGDTKLVDSLKHDDLQNAPKYYEYSGKAKPKEQPVVIENQRVFPRKKKTAINALVHANYLCEIDQEHPTFIRKNSDKPYTEPHHLVPVAYSDDFDVSLDVEENIVSLCSNCHNQIHYGKGAENLLKKLYEERKELLKKVHIDITFEQLLSYYK